MSQSKRSNATKDNRHVDVDLRFAKVSAPHIVLSLAYVGVEIGALKIGERDAR
jgi:hypothetical protein